MKNLCTQSFVHSAKAYEPQLRLVWQEDFVKTKSQAWGPCLRTLTDANIIGMPPKVRPRKRKVTPHVTPLQHTGSVFSLSGHAALVISVACATMLSNVC